MLDVDVAVVGGGPAGLAAAASAARGGLKTLVLEQSTEIGSPTRTTGGSFVADLQDLGIPENLYHVIRRGRFLSPNNSATFNFDNQGFCVIDVRRVFQFLAEMAVRDGADISLATTVDQPIVEAGSVVGIKARKMHGGELTIKSRVMIDATGYRALMSKRAGLDPGFKRFGVGAEYDIYCPSHDQNEAVLIVGSQIAPSGYAWVFPWGNQRVRIGVGIIHGDSRENPQPYLEKLLREYSQYDLDLKRATPIEYHYGMIPSERFRSKLVDNGIMVVGDAGAQASSLVGEGIRWAIKAGRMAGEVAVEAVRRNDYSRESLAEYERRWSASYGRNLRIAHAINRIISRWTDSDWDYGVGILKRLTPAEFVQALGANFVAGWPIHFLRRNPALIPRLARRFGGGFMSSRRAR